MRSAGQMSDFQASLLTGWCLSSLTDLTELLQCVAVLVKSVILSKADGNHMKHVVS